MTDSSNFKIIQTLASGGTAVLFKAIQVSLDRIVAVKRLHQHLTNDEDFTRRFILEAKAAASLDNENIVHVIDFGHDGDRYQMVMEFVEGESLNDILARWRPIKYDLALAIVRQICMGLEHAHSKGIVHRDIKPGNVMVTQTGRVKITDFGLAKLTQTATSHTATQSIIGTPLYMSPEQAFGESVDHRSDLFSLGTVLYELLTGKQPFSDESYMGVIQNIINKEIPPVDDYNPEIPREVRDIVSKALSRNREHRFQTAREFREVIESYMGLERLNQATINLKILLDKTTDRPVTNSTFIKPVRKKRSRLGAGALAAFVLVASASTAVILKPSLLDALRATFGNNTNGAGTQRAAADDPVGYHFDISSLVEDGAGVGDAPPAARGTDTVSVVVRDTVFVGVGPEPERSEGQPVTQAKETAVKPAAKIGYLRINALPSAEIYVDGIYKADTPPALSLELKAGSHKVECRHPRYETYAEVLKIVTGEMSRRDITMRKLKGMVTLTTTQEGAEVYIDGKLFGVTPVRQPIELDVGPHLIALQKTGFLTWSSEVTVDAQKTLPLRITLSPRY